jgi:autotransporter-associated beta strand protein
MKTFHSYAVGVIASKSPRNKLALAVLAAATAHVGMAQAASVYNDNFNRSDLNSGTYSYGVTLSTVPAGNDSAASIVGNDVLTLTNDSTGAANVISSIDVSTPMSAFSSPFNSTLSQNTGNAVEWSLNMQFSRSNPSGFSIGASGTYGEAFVLGGTNSNFQASGDGYALVIGNSGTPDPIKLVRYTGGLGGTFTTIAAAASDAGTSFYSVKVRYDSTNNAWTLSTRNDGGSFVDPQNTSTPYTIAGTQVDSGLVSTSLSFLGAHINNATAAILGRFDNFNIDLSPAIVASGRNLVWNGSSGNWETANNWLDGVTPATFSSATPDNATFSNAALPATVTLGTNVTVGSLTFAASAPVHTLTGGGLAINNALTADQSVNIDTPITVGGINTWAVASGKTVTISQPMAGSAPITKSGTGTVNFTSTGSASFSGAVTINGGAIRVSASDGSGNSGLGNGSVIINSGGAFELNNVSLGVAGGTNGPSVLMNNGSTLRSLGSSTLTRSGSPRIATAAGTSVTMDIAAGGTLSFGAALRNDVTSIITSPAVIHVTGGGVLYLQTGATSTATNADHFSGSWVVDSGILQAGPLPDGNFGEPLNALGYRYGATGATDNANPVTVNSGGVLAGGVDAGTGNFKTPVIFNGGALGSTGNANAAFSGPLTFNASTSSSLLVQDPSSPSTSKTLSLVSNTGTPGSISWGANATVNVVGGGTLNITRDTGATTAVSVGAGAAMNIPSGATVNLGGTLDALSSGTTSVNVANSGSFNVTAGSKNIGNLTGTGTTSIAGGSSLSAGKFVQAAVQLQGGNAIANVRTGAANNDPAKLSVIGNLTGVDSGLLDLNNSDLVLPGASLANVQNAIKSAAGTNDAFDGTVGITSSAAKTINAGSGAKTALGVAQAGNVNITSFDGQGVNPSDILVKYTLLSDANLDSKVNALDFNRLASHYGESSSTWANGDFNYDGSVDSTDFSALSANFNALLPAPPPGAPLGTLVPEPGSIIFGLAGLAMLRRTRRQ